MILKSDIIYAQDIIRYNFFKKPMLNSNYSLKIDPEKHSKILNTWLAIIIILAIALIAAALILKFSNNKNNSQPVNNLVNQENKKTELHSYSGSIVKINNDNIIIKANANKNYLKTDTEITVNFNDQTQFFTLTIPQQLSGSPIKDQINKEIVDKKALEVGQNVFATSLENILDKTFFTANKIEIQLIK